MEKRPAPDRKPSQVTDPKSKWKIVLNCRRFPNRNVQTYGYVYHDTNGLNHGPVWKTQSFLLSEICMVILWQDGCGKGGLGKFYGSTFGTKFIIWECLFVHRERGLLLSVYVDDVNSAGKRQNIDPMWEVLNKEVDGGSTNIIR